MFLAVLSTSRLGFSRHQYFGNSRSFWRSFDFVDQLVHSLSIFVNRSEALYVDCLNEDSARYKGEIAQYMDVCLVAQFALQKRRLPAPGGPTKATYPRVWVAIASRRRASVASLRWT